MLLEALLDKLTYEKPIGSSAFLLYANTTFSI